MSDEFEKRLQAYLDEDVEYAKEKGERKEVVDIICETISTNQTSLDIGAKFVSKLPPIPNHITTLDMTHTRIQYIGESELPDSLTTLDCSKSHLRALPKRLPPRLKRLIINNTPIMKLPPLPDTLKHLHCDYTFISELPEVLPSSLNRLSIHNTLICSLPELPSTLETLCCNNTFLPSQLPNEDYILRPDNKYLEKLKKHQELIERNSVIQHINRSV
jgi:hypothetical protein